MKFNWAWIVLVAVLALVAYKAGKMPLNEGLYPHTTGSLTFMTFMIVLMVVVVLIFGIGMLLYNGVKTTGYLINRAGHSMYNGIIKR
jgi:hypothetical protein